MERKTKVCIDNNIRLKGFLRGGRGVHSTDNFPEDWLALFALDFLFSIKPPPVQVGVLRLFLLKNYSIIKVFKQIGNHTRHSRGSRCWLRLCFSVPPSHQFRHHIGLFADKSRDFIVEIMKVSFPFLP